MKRPPEIKTAAGQRLWDQVTAGYALEQHHCEILLRAALQVDRAAALSKVLAKEGVTQKNRYDATVIHPAVAAERQAATTAARLLRELQLDFSSTEAADFRLPRIAATEG